MEIPDGLECKLGPLVLDERADLLHHLRVLVDEGSDVSRDRVAGTKDSNLMLNYWIKFLIFLDLLDRS